MTHSARTRGYIALLIAFSLQIALLACGGPGAPTPLPTATASLVTPTATPVPAPTATPAPPAGLSRGGILRFAIKEAPPHQDVHQSVSNVLATWGAGIAYSRLFRYQAGPGVPAPSRIPECDLCESWKQTGPLEFEFKMREDAFWPDVAPVNGRRVTAQDVVFSYQRQMKPGWPNAEILANIQEVAAFDETRLRIRLHAPDAEFFERLADGHSVVVAEEVVQLNGNLFNGPTIGSGPWVLEETSTAGATFEANRDYYEAGLPYLDGLSMQFIAQDSTRAAGVRSGILDMDQSTLEEVKSATDRFPELQTLTMTRPGTGVELALNTSRRPLDALAVRQAVLLAWDLEAALTDIWGGELEPSVGLNLPHPDWTADFDGLYADMFGDTDAANRLLNGAGLTPSDRLTIIVGEFGEAQGSDRFAQTAESLAGALNSLGLAAEVVRVTTRLFAENVWIGGDYDIFVGAPPPVSSLSGQLFGVYHSEGPWNTTGFSTPELDALIEQQAVENDPVERGRLLLQIQDAIMSGVHRFYPGTGVAQWMWRPTVQGLVPDTSGASSDFLRRVWLKRE
ncbi:MAG: ABC transporter substrate-binding protein [Chloroflexi bacterium]|nr:ABC transporter substrate-binding protein [Chloroflexota bacterium]